MEKNEDKKLSAKPTCEIQLKLKNLDDDDQDNIEVYPKREQPRELFAKRWLVLLAIVLLNVTNSMSWIAYSPVGNFVNSVYGDETAKWLALVFMISAVPIGVFAMWADDKFGLRAAIWTAGLMNAVGSLIRVGSLMPIIPDDKKFAVCLLGQTVASVAYPFIMFMPSKVAGVWFGEDERALATTIGVISSPLGVLVANVFAPALIHSPDDVFTLHVVLCVPCVLAAFVALFGVDRCEPSTPPTLSAALPQMAFVDGLKACFTTPAYLVLLFVLGGGIGMFNCLYTIMQSLLCPYGYTNSLAGLCSAALIVGGTTGATLAGLYVDRSKRYAETIKVCMACAVCLGIVFLQLVLWEDLALFLLATCLLFGFFGMATYPVGLVLASECTFPVSETTSAGLVMLSGQVQGAFYVVLMNLYTKPLPANREGVQVCRKEQSDVSNAPKDYSVSTYVLALIAALMLLVLVSCFRPSYKRMQSERREAAGETVVE